jgi:hypothetical protein
MKFVPRWLSLRSDVHEETEKNLKLAEHTRNFVRRWLSQRWNCFRVGSLCDNIDSALTEPAHARILVKNQRSPTKTRFPTLKNLNFDKPTRNRSNSSNKMNIKQILRYHTTKKWCCVCLVKAEIFWTRTSRKNQKKRILIFSNMGKCKYGYDLGKNLKYSLLVYLGTDSWARW